MKKQILLILAFIILVGLMSVSVVFAWFSVLERTQPILIYSGTVDLTANLYDVTQDDEVEITEAYNISNVIPGDIYHFRIDFVHTGTLKADLVLVFNIDSNNAYLVNVNYIDSNNTNTKLDLINNKVIYNNLTPNTSLSINFEIKVNESLTLDDVSNLSVFTILNNIELVLTQVGGN